ncbi:unnamed protein product [Closterium sp. NIES-53]
MGLLRWWEVGAAPFRDKGSDSEEALVVVHIDFRVPAKDSSLYFLLLKYRKTRYVWVRPAAKKGDVLLEFEKNSPSSYTPQQNGMAEREMWTVVEAVQTMLLHMGVKHHWRHLTLRLAVWVRNRLEESTLPPVTTPHQLLTLPCKGWEVLDLTDNKVVTTVVVIFYETVSLEVWQTKYGPALGRTQANPPIDSSSATFPLLAEIGGPDVDDAEDVPPHPPHNEVVP